MPKKGILENSILELTCCGTLRAGVMTRNKTKFTQFKEKENGYITYDDNKDKILESGEIDTTSLMKISDVQLVKG